MHIRGRDVCYMHGAMHAHGNASIFALGRNLYHNNPLRIYKHTEQFSHARMHTAPRRTQCCGQSCVAFKCRARWCLCVGFSMHLNVIYVGLLFRLRKGLLRCLLLSTTIVYVDCTDDVNRCRTDRETILPILNQLFAHVEEDIYVIKRRRRSAQWCAVI